MLKEVYNRLALKHFYIGISILLFILLIEIVATIYIPNIRKWFFNVLVLKDSHQFIVIMLYFTGLMAILTIAQSFKTWWAQKVALNVRSTMTDVFLDKWLRFGNTKISNPAQRINLDCSLATDLTLTVLVEVFISALIVISLVISSYNDITVLLLSGGYTAIIILGSFLFKKPLVAKDIELQDAEADHRVELTKVSFNQKDDAHPYTAYGIVTKAYTKYINVLLGFTIFNKCQGNFTPLIGYLLLIGAFFAGTSTLGEYMARVTVFELIVVNSTILVQLYPTVTKASASYKRLGKFWESLNV